MKNKSRPYLLLPSLMSIFLLSAMSPANAWDVTFTRNKSGNRTSSNFNLRVVLEQQTNAAITSTETRGECLILWNVADGEGCTIEDFPSSTNALVTVYSSSSPHGGQRSVIGKIQFWVGIFENSEIHIPTGVVSFKADQTWSELAGVNCCNVAILPQANIEMGETYSNRPNSLLGYYGENLGNCGAKDLASDQETSCEIDFLAGCYSPVFARPRTDANKTKIWVNRTDSGIADNALCVKDGDTVDYLIKVQ